MIKPCPLCNQTNSYFERTLNGIRLVKCANCQFVFTSLSDEEIEQANAIKTEQIVASYAARQTMLDELWFQMLAQRLTRLIGKGKVLDVGCGTGKLLQYFRQMGWDCFGVDLSTWSRSFAEEIGFTFLHGKVETLTIEENSFDLIVSTSTLEHIPNPIPHLRAVLQLLRSGGVVYFAGMPNYGSLTVRLGLSQFHHNFPPKHANYFTASTLKKTVERAKIPLKQVSIQSYGIPDLHQVYNAITQLNRKNSTKKSLSSQKTNLTKTVRVKPWIGRQFVRGNYWLGRIGQAGDKLEALLVRG